MLPVMDWAVFSHYVNISLNISDESRLQWRPDPEAENLTLRPKQNGRHFPDDIFKRIFLNENAWISLKISLKFVPNGPINNIQHWFR